MNHQPSKTVSLYLTRFPQTQNSYVHVLRCNNCDYLTLNPTNFKEHFRSKHPKTLGFWTYSCFQCSSMSTEKSLMEEHLRLYHRLNDNSTGKLIERFHEPSTFDLLSNPASTVAGGTTTIPLTLTSTHVPAIASGGSNVNVMNALQIMNKSPVVSTTNSLTDSALTCNSDLSTNSPAILTASSSPIPPLGTDKLVEYPSEVKSEDSCSVNPNESTNNSLVSTGCAVSGSRRRKATTPGRICPQTTNGNDDRSELDEDLSSENQKMKSNGDFADVSMSDTDQLTFGKRSTCTDESIGNEVQDNYHGPPSPKRACTIDFDKPDNNIITAALSQAGSGLPFVLSISNTCDTSQTGLFGARLNKLSTSPSFTVSPQQLGAIPTTGGPVMGQLIPIAGLPEHLLCGISTTLLGGNNNQSLSQSLLANHGTSFSVPVLDNQSSMTNAGSSSTWVLTNQPNNANTNFLATQNAMTTLQPTLLVPLPATLTDSTTVSNMRSLSTQFVEANPTATSVGTTATNTSNILRLSDLLEAVKSVISGGGLISSISLPVSKCTVNYGDICGHIKYHQSTVKSVFHNHAKPN
ncbi:hypothetical protein AHF37_08398 [Paragonimus kellicotti]|nr:hypothetical protein AHF37_08398 [Paragonimus kellicotti]